MAEFRNLLMQVDIDVASIDNQELEDFDLFIKKFFLTFCIFR